MLLRAPMPARDGPGMADRLRLLLKPPGSEQPTTEIEAAANAPKIELRAEGVEARCEASADLPPLRPPPAPG